MLLLWGANPNATDANGATALHEAIARKHEDVASALVQAGANVKIEAYQGPFEGKSALDLIRTSDYHWSSAFINSIHVKNGVEVHDRTTPELEHENDISDLLKNQLSIATNHESGKPITNGLLSINTNNDFSAKGLSLNGPISPLAPVITDERLNLIWPQPSLVKQLTGEPFVFPNQMPLTVSGSSLSIHK